MRIIFEPFARTAHTVGAAVPTQVPSHVSCLHKGSGILHTIHRHRHTIRPFINVTTDAGGLEDSRKY